MSDSAENRPIIFWHRELPPLDAEPVSEHVAEADSPRVQGTLEHRTELWDRCYADLMDRVKARLTQEIARLNGDFAHVLDESVDSRHDEATGDVWLHGSFRYLLLRRQR